MNIATQDRTILRDLAKQAEEIGNQPAQKERAELWTKHNDLQKVRPLVLIFPEGAWREMMPDTDLVTTSPDARGIERGLRIRIYYWQHMQDDNPIEPTWWCWAATKDTGYGVSQQRTHPDQKTGADHFEPVIKTEDDIDKIRIPQVTVDREASLRNLDEMKALLGDILQVELIVHAYNGISIVDEFATWRGLDQMLYDLADRPEWVHKAMEKMLQGAVSRHETMIGSGLVTLNNRNHYTGSGGNGYTRQLPARGYDGVHVRSCDLWGFATTQMFSEVSPAMHEEFALRYERRFLARFGLASYGCCEPLHNKLDIVKTIPNLRRISISPWADLKKSAEELGGKYIFSWKPNPAIMAGESWDPGVVRRGIREALEITRGCVVEMVMKDTHTCRGKPERMWDWVRIAREEAERFGG